MTDNPPSISPEKLRQAFLELKNPRDVARLLGYSYAGLVYRIYKIPETEKYTAFEIPKKSGGIRLINSPSRPIKLIQRRLNEVLQSVYIPKPVAYGFIRGRNIVENARSHKKKNWVLNLDLEEFFPSINFGRVRGMFMSKPYKLSASVATILAQICCYKNELPQGAPTSPIISNMICAKLDSELQDLAWQYKCFYTRYADDITFSTTLLEFPVEIASVTPEFNVALGRKLVNIVRENGFDINQKKTRAFPRHKRQEVTGLTVNKFPNVTRKYIMQIRSMLHDWDKTNLQLAGEKHATFDSSQKHRNPEGQSASFKQIVRGKINFLKMVKGANDKRYQEFRHDFQRLSRRDKGVPLTNIAAATEKQLTVYTEGPTDALILQTAWEKLYESESFLFKIKEVEIEKGVDGGVDALCNELNTHRKEHGIVIGIFDRDPDGIDKGFNKLHQVFIKKDGCGISVDRKAGALLLPIPPGKENLAKFKLLWIENYFSVSALNLKTDDGYGLSFKVKNDAHSGETKEKNTITDDELELATIKDGKQIFAEQIVPTLPAEEFEGFRLVFEKITFIVERLH